MKPIAEYKTRQDVIDFIEEFEGEVGFQVANQTAHIVTQDYNLEDHHIDFCLDYIVEHRADIIAEEISSEEIKRSIEFLYQLKTIPLAIRHDPHWDK